MKLYQQDKKCTLSKGIKDKYINETIEKINEENEDQDFFSAVKLCKKKNRPARNESNRPLFLKDIKVLARADLILRFQEK